MKVKLSGGKGNYANYDIHIFDSPQLFDLKTSICNNYH